MNTICQYADKHGLLTPDLHRLLDLAISPSSLDQANRGFIFKSLYPASKVPPDVIYKAVNSLGHGAQKPPASAQVALLRWLVMVYPTLEDSADFSSLYSVFFNMLGRMDIRAPLCHLLAMITRRKHVKPFRLDILRQLASDVPREPALEKLMRIYDHLGPDHLDAAAAKGPSIVFPHPDPVWGDQLQMIQQQTGLTSISPGMYTESFTFSVLRKDLKNGSNLPSGRSEHSEHRSRNALDMTNVNDIVKHLENLDVPLLKFQDLDDRLLHQYLVLRSGEEITTQLESVFTPVFDRQFDALAKGEDVKKSTLETIFTHTRLTKARFLLYRPETYAYFCRPCQNQR